MKIIASLLMVMVALAQAPCPTWAIDDVAGRSQYTWEQNSAYPVEYSCWYDNQQIGSYNAKRHLWIPLNRDGTWGEPCDLPQEIPMPPGVKRMPKPTVVGQAPPAPEAAGKPLFGVIRDKVPTKESYQLCGPDGCDKNASKEQAMAAINRTGPPAIDAGQPLVDDSKALRLAIIGTPDERKPLDDALAADTAMTGHVLVQSMGPDEWMAKDCGASDGHPEIILTAAPDKPGGEAKVLYRANASPGPDVLLAEIRKRDPNYDPSKDPGPANPGTGDEVNPLLLIGLVGVVIAVIVANKRRQAPQ